MLIESSDPPQTPEGSLLALFLLHLTKTARDEADQRSAGGGSTEPFLYHAQYLFCVSAYAGFSALTDGGISRVDNFTVTGAPSPPTATALPATLPLFATGLGAMGLFGWRRKRKNAATLAVV